VRRVDFGDVVVLAGVEADTLAQQASVVRKGELRRVAVFVLDQSPPDACPALDAFCWEQFGTQP
jgi:hypothetical protein